jgi:predicted secreted protein
MCADIYFSMFYYKTVEDMFNFENYRRYNAAYNDYYCHYMGGHYITSIAGSTEGLIYYDAYCTHLLKKVDPLSCEQDSRLYIISTVSFTTQNDFDTDITEAFNLGYRYYSFAYPANCVNYTLFDPRIVDRNDDVLVGHFTVDTLANTTKVFEQQLPALCNDTAEAWSADMRAALNSSAQAAATDVTRVLNETLNGKFENVQCSQKS